MHDPFLIYGATGYSGTLIARAAAARGLKPVLAGRNAVKLGALAEELGLEHVVLSLDEPQRLDSVLREMALVLHAAGPFSTTALPMVESCLRTRTHYLD